MPTGLRSPTLTGRTVDYALTAQRGKADIGGQVAATWLFNDTVPGPLLRATQGDRLRVVVRNQIPESTTVHWHGIALVNPMDGVPDVTQTPIDPGASFTYDFVLPDAGTYWFHPHEGVQLDHGLYAPLIVEDPNEPLGYDQEWVLVLDDWTDGMGPSPQGIDRALREGKGNSDSDSGGMDMGSDSNGTSGMDHGSMGGRDGGSGIEASDKTMAKPGALGGDWNYPAYLANGRLPNAPDTLSTAVGKRIRVRVINAASDTAFRLWLDGHQLSATHADGFPVRPVTVDQLVIGMGERYDVLITAGDGKFSFNALPDGKPGGARAVLSTGSGTTPPLPTAPPVGRTLAYADLQPSEAAQLPTKKVDQTVNIALTGTMKPYVWTIDGKPFDPNRRIAIDAGKRIRLVFANSTTMWHPMHLHGHTFALPAANWVRKDTVIVAPRSDLAVDFDADNPGAWMIHCHNIYHAQAGMMAIMAYAT